MDIKRIIAIAALMAVTITAMAGTGDKPVRIGASVTVGTDSYSTVSALQGTLATYETEAQSGNWLDRGTAFGVEGSVILGGRWRIDVGGTFGFSSNPGYAGLPGTAEGGVLEPGDIPAYRAVASQKSLSYLLYVAGSYYFDIPSVKALKPYVGLRALGSYGNNWKEYNEAASMGRSVSETLAIGASAIAGVDYFISSSVYVGAGFDVFRYVYSYTAHKPQEGLGNLAANSHNFGFFSAPVLKIGFLF